MFKRYQVFSLCLSPNLLEMIDVSLWMHCQSHKVSIHPVAKEIDYQEAYVLIWSCMVTQNDGS